MFPSFELGPLSFPAYFTLLMIGFLVAIHLAVSQCDRVGVDRNRMLDMSILVILAGIGGSRLLHVVADGYFMDYVHLCVDPLQVEPQLLPGERLCTEDAQCVQHDRGDLCHPDEGTCHPGQDCLRAFKFWYGGLTYYGGFIGAFLVAYWFVRRTRMPTWRVADLTGFGIALGLVFGRVGCFLSGCCFGARTGSFIGLSFPRKSPAWHAHVKEHLISHGAPESLAVYPSQVFHALSNLGIFLICFWMFRRRRSYDGKVFWWFIALYAVSRFVLEYWRADQRGEWFFGLVSTSQLISIPLLAVALLMMRHLKRRAPFRAPDAHLQS